MASERTDDAGSPGVPIPSSELHIMDSMQSGLPFSAFLSRTYVAFTIEFDSEFERQVPHRTAHSGATPGFPRAPWLVSMHMWLRFMRYIPIKGIEAADLQSQLAISTKALQIWLTRLGRWWGYLTIEDPVRKSSSSRVAPDVIVRPTPGGCKAIEVWQTLLPLMETRWRAALGVPSDQNATTEVLAAPPQPPRSRGQALLQSFVFARRAIHHRTQSRCHRNTLLNPRPRRISH
jgi:hypothetical protein